MMINTDRSRIETYQKCHRLRYLQYEYALQGLDLDDSAVALNIGSAVHKGVEEAMRLGLEGQNFTVDRIVRWTQSSPEYAALENQDDKDLVEALVRTWWFAGLPTLQGWQILDVEREENYTPPPQLWLDPRIGNDTVRFMSRSDFIARAGGELTLNNLPVAPGLYNWNLKTWRDCGERRRKSMLYDAQVFTELFGPEARMGERFAGVIYQVLVKEDHPLVWAWRSNKTGELVGCYRWTCAAAHENTHTKAGGWCPGGKLHRLGGEYERVPVRDAIEGGQAVWFEQLCATDPDLLREFHVILGPKMRASDYEMEEWKDTWTPREAEIRRAALAVEKARIGGKAELVERLLRQYFPKETAHGNCQWPYPCPALAICHEGASSEDYPLRVANHSQEKET